MGKNNPSAEELQEQILEILEASLTEDEKASLLSIKRDLGANIRWGKVVAKALGPILCNLENVIFEGGKGLVKRVPIEALFPSKKRTLETGTKAQLSRHFVLLHLTKKLLGALKTRVNQALSDIRIIGFDEETKLLEILTDPGETSGTELDQKFSRWVNEGGEDPREEARYAKTPSPLSEAEVQAQLALDNLGPCEHARTVVRRVKAKGRGRSCDTLETLCKDCHTATETRLVAQIRKGSKKKKDEPCKHRYLQWVEGQEGQVAECSDKEGCEYRISDPEILKTFQWESVGLEPPGDDPSQDEVAII